MSNATISDGTIKNQGTHNTVIDYAMDTSVLWCDIMMDGTARDATLLSGGGTSLHRYSDRWELSFHIIIMENHEVGLANIK